MPHYRRLYELGGTYWLTLVTEGRARILCKPAGRLALRGALRACRRRWPFCMVAISLLPDHLHMIWTLPPNDSEFSRRVAFVKREFTVTWLDGGGLEQERSPSRLRQRRRGVWQRRFWEHVVCDPEELGALVDYTHYNACHHGLVRCPHEWPYSSFHRYVREGILPLNWECACRGPVISRRNLPGPNVLGE